MSSTPSEMINNFMWEEFIQTYTENDIVERYAIENDLNMTLDEINENDVEDFKEMMFEEYKTERIGDWH